MESYEIIKIQNIKFYSHPIYSKYFASEDGQIISKKHKKILKFWLNRDKGYQYFSLFIYNTKKSYLVSRFVYECFKGEIPVDKDVDHIDSNKKNNSINNLQLLSHKENVRKARCKKVISLNIETQEEKIFDSIKEAGEFYDIFASNISAICKKKMKTSKSKKDGKKYQFFYL